MTRNPPATSAPRLARGGALLAAAVVASGSALAGVALTEPTATLAAWSDSVTVQMSVGAGGWTSEPEPGRRGPDVLGTDGGHRPASSAGAPTDVPTRAAGAAGADAPAWPPYDAPSDGLGEGSRDDAAVGPSDASAENRTDGPADEPSVARGDGRTPPEADRDSRRRLGRDRDLGTDVVRPD